MVNHYKKKASGESELVKLPFKINLTPSPTQSSSHRRSDLNKQKGKHTMTKKNIRPQQVAPVERETISTAKDQSGQVTPLFYYDFGVPFAGDDAE